MIEAVIAITVAHGLVSTLVHGYPSITIAAKVAKEEGRKDLEFNKVIFLLGWCVCYTLLTPISVFKMFKPRDEVIFNSVEIILKAKD
jgi:hypothetical protein